MSVCPLDPDSSDFGDVCALYAPFLHQLTMQSSLFERGCPVVCVARKLRPCPSYSGRRDCINLGLWRSLYKGGGGVRSSSATSTGAARGCTVASARHSGHCRAAELPDKPPNDVCGRFRPAGPRSIRCAHAVHTPAGPQLHVAVAYVAHRALFVCRKGRLRCFQGPHGLTCSRAQDHKLTRPHPKSAQQSTHPQPVRQSAQ